MPPFIAAGNKLQIIRKSLSDTDNYGKSYQRNCAVPSISWTVFSAPRRNDKVPLFTFKDPSLYKAEMGHRHSWCSWTWKTNILYHHPIV